MPYSGLTNAIVSGELTQHEEKMLAAPVDVRDGDEQISTVGEPSYEGVDLGNSSADEVTLSTDSHYEVEEEELTEESDNNLEEEETELTEDNLEVDMEADEAPIRAQASQWAEARQGQEELISAAIERGMNEEMVDSLSAHYEEHGSFTEEQYSELAKVGYSKGFVDSYMKGQEAIAESFAQSIIKYAGGDTAYNQVTSNMSNETVEAYNSAVSRGDTATIKALIDSGKSSLTAKYGKRPAQDILAGKPTKAVAPVAKNKPVGFKNTDEMVKAMSDRRYIHDAKYRHEVEQKVRWM